MREKGCAANSRIGSRQLLKSPAWQNNGLCITITRIAVHELSDRAYVTVHDLENLAPANGALERFDPNTDTGKITDEYLSDRANFLERALWFNTQDKNPYNPSAGELVPGRSIFENESRYLEDAVSGYKIQQGGLFPNTPRYYFGDNQANNPAASAVADHLYGGGGDDTLTGGEGEDYLEGGAGTDTYTFTRSDSWFNCVLSINLAPPRSLKFQI